MPNEKTRRWLVATAKRNFWRVAGYYDLADLIQDGYLVYYKVCQKYPDAQPAQQLRLFQRSFINHIHTLSIRAHKSDIVPIDDTVSLPCEYSDLLRTVVEAPELVRKTLNALASKQFREHRIRPNKLRQTTSEMLCQLVGVKPTVNLHSMLLNYLSEK